MVPQFRPRAALHLLERVLSGAPWAPPLLADADLAGLSDDAFAKYMDDWTVRRRCVCGDGVFRVLVSSVSASAAAQFGLQGVYPVGYSG